MPAGTSTPIVAFDWGGRNTQTLSGSGGGSGKAIIGDFSFTRQIDQYSQKLFRLAVLGLHTNTVVVHVYQPNSNADEARYTFTNVIVSSFRHYANGTPDYAMPLDRVTIKFRKVCVEGFAPFNGTAQRGGTSAVCYSLATNTTS